MHLGGITGLRPKIVHSFADYHVIITADFVNVALYLYCRMHSDHFTI